MKVIPIINYILAALIFVCYSYQLIYMAVPFIKKKKPYEQSELHKYAVLIAARNEEAVIARLIESIHDQTYPSELVEIFVVADNCTDDTAARARAAGATVWERFDDRQVGKGYAIDFLLQKIGELYPENPFDGYFIFDADNLLDENYISEMNKSFSNGNRIITSYRNSKNYGKNWISAGTALWFLWESQYMNRSRMLLGTSCAVSGTGFLVHRDIIEKSGGWKYFLLTEDIEFSIHNIVNGEKIAYCESAVIYDEQPVRFSQSWNQRMRWAKGNMQVSQKYGARMARSIFKSFSNYDMSMTVSVAIILATFSVFVNLIGIGYELILHGNAILVVRALWESLYKAYFMFYLLGLITTITEWKKIYCSAVKKILYTFTFPLFMFTYVPNTFAAVFAKVEWKKIEHKESMSLNDVREHFI